MPSLKTYSNPEYVYLINMLLNHQNKLPPFTLLYDLATMLWVAFQLTFLIIYWTSDMLFHYCRVGSLTNDHIYKNGLTNDWVVENA